MLITEVSLLSNDLVETEAFYGRTLRLPLISQSAFHRSFRVGHSVLTFWLSNECKPFYHLAFEIPLNQIHEAHAWLSARTPILSFSADGWLAHFENWQAQAFYFHDPAGSILECIGRQDRERYSTRPFDASSLIGINEVGIVVDDVTGERERLRQEYNLPDYDKGPQLAEFSALGEEEGLLIISQAGRGWLPTGRPAEKHPVEVRWLEERLPGTLTVQTLRVGYERMVEPQLSPNW